MAVLSATPPRELADDLDGGPAGADAPDPVAERISAVLTRMFRHGARMKAEMANAVFAGVEVAALVALHKLREHGPQRAGELADRLHVDPSQVSRLVAVLVREGLVVRRADPHDGRATQLVPTAAGAALGDRFARARAAQVAAVVADWDPDEADAFAAQLDRFVAGMERVLPGRPASDRDGGDAAPDTSPDHRRGHHPHHDPHAEAGAQQ